LETGIVGRAEEVRTLESFLIDAIRGPSGLVLDGEPGIGKTTVWEEGVRQARAAGFRVLVARPAEGEASLPYAALADLVEPLIEDGADVPDAIEAVLAGRAATGLAVSRAVLDRVRGATVDRPLLIAVDDVQWLDEASEGVFAFLTRRLGGLSVGILLARRTSEIERLPLGLERAIREVVHCRVGPLSLSELDRVLEQRLGAHLPRPRLERLHRASGGNPLYALEIARSLAGADGHAEELPLPPQLVGVLRERIRALPAAAAEAALFAAACLQPAVGLVEEAAGGWAGLSDAIAFDVLRIERDRLLFTHPLLAEATYASATPWERRAAHARLAVVAEEVIERAHHLARSVERPDDDVAHELERAAAEAATRGAPTTAADLAEQAARLSVEDSERDTRSIAAAEYRLVAGDPDGARVALQEVAARLLPGALRARVLALIAELTSTADPERSLELQLEALEEAREDPRRAAEIQLALSTTTWNLGRLHASTEHTRAAVRLAEQAGDDALLAAALGELLHCEMILGLPLSEDAAVRALTLERSLERLPQATYFRPSISLAIVYTAVDRPDDARPLLTAELTRLQATGDEAIRWGVLSRLADLELRVGNLGDAVRLGHEALDSVRLLDHRGIERWALVPYSAALAHAGQLDEARTIAAEALAQSDASASRITALRARGTLGFCALSEDRHAEAWEILAPAVEELQEIGVGELSLFGVAQNAIDALVALDRLDDCENIVSWVEERGRAAQRSWHRAIAARGRALITAARGDGDAACTALAEAFAAHVDLPQPFELARTLLVKGQIERRAKRRRTARDALTTALELFDTLGAARWAEKTAAELARIPGRAGGGDELTETERRVAELVGQGFSNKEVAAKLFVTVRAVEANLSKVYAKLGVRSRTELASRLHSR
jgi:DNA-binding CsgD family transcriptional regulator